ncbi:hypothetical protein IFM46972_10343 [Aspergillus udagawae]|uniref:Uncharacterized protein n=1 Tax=Aspergillus udagawae TaxID=91492 RepID=A0A8H3SBR7_9EURO|nr:hypothetical protein IFM46972_10343 [Aspergillus udagawae]
MACNCLPSAKSSQQASVETIPITRAFLHKIKSGSAIADLPIGDAVSNAATRYLSNLPSSEGDNYYKGFCPPQVLSQPGTIYNHGRQPISTWAEAVAGIAFGGLVPLAAVRFTVGGGEGLGRSNELLERIINVVDEQTAQWLPGLHLFGRQQDDFGSLYRSTLLIEFYLNETDYDVRNVVWRLDRYSTLNERLTAAYQGEGIDDAATRSKEVYERTCHEIQLYLNQALGRHNKQRSGPRELSPRERSTQYNLNSFLQGGGRGGHETNTGDRLALLPK